MSNEALTEPFLKRKWIMVTININVENGHDAADVCREVARLIENGYTNGMIGCSGDTFEIEGDIFSDEDEDDEFTPTESGKTEVRIDAVESHCYRTSYLGDAVYTTRLRLNELFGEDNGAGDKTNHEFSFVFDVKFKDGSSDQFGVDLYDWKCGEMPETEAIIWNIGCNDSFNSSIAREVIDMLIGGRMENDEYKILEINKK